MIASVADHDRGRIVIVSVMDREVIEIIAESQSRFRRRFMITILAQIRDPSTTDSQSRSVADPRRPLGSFLRVGASLVLER